MSIKKNFYYSSILTVSGYIFPLFTYPYVSRVLGVTNIGICNFVDSIINYFVLFSMMGIQTLGIREIANARNNKGDVSRTFYSIIALNLILCVIFCTLLIVSIFIVPQFYEYKELMFIGVGKLVSAFLLIEWFYKGLEQFKYISIRTIIVRCIFVVSVFLFIKSENDYKIYFLLLVFTELANALINSVHSKSFLLRPSLPFQPSKYLTPVLILGIYTLLTTMYKSFNVVFLGFVSTPEEVGYYTTATKLHHIFIGLFAAFSGVMMPKMSSLISEGKIGEFRNKLDDSVSLLIYFSLPLIVIGSTFTSEIIALISGPGYEKAKYPLLIVLPLVFIIGFEQILVHQILMPLKKDGVILFNSVLGAIVGICANFLLVKHMGCVGSSLVWSMSEICVMISALYFARSVLPVKIFASKFVLNCLYAVPAYFLCYIVRYFFSSLVALFLSITLVLLYYIYIYLFLIKDKLFFIFIPARFKKWKQKQE